MPVAIDHIILAVDDLEVAAGQLLDATGLAAVPGGEHPDWGTANVIVPLGVGYLELVTVVDPDVAAGSAFGRLVAAGTGLVGWAASVDDLDAVATRHGLEVVPGHRTLADGSTLSWRMAGATTALAADLPFFLQWDDPSSNPAHTPAPHTAEPHGISWLETSNPLTQLTTWLGPHTLDLRATSGPPRAAIAVGDGEVIVPVG